MERAALASALSDFRDGLADLFSNMNDCHDEGGKFCEGGGGSSGAGSGDKSRPRNGISPQASVSSAERKGKEYGYAKKVSFYQCTSVDQANEINAQLAELSDETGLTLERVFVYKEGGKSKEAPKNAIGYHSQSEGTMGIMNGSTAEYALRNAPYQPGKQEENAKWLREYADKMEQEHLTNGGRRADPEVIKAFRYQAEQAMKYKDYAAHTEPGNGVRNPTIDHEFAHALVGRAIHSQDYRELTGGTRKVVNDRAVVRLNGLAERCVSFAETEKFSSYAVSGYNMNWVVRGEAIAECYARYRAGKPVPDDIAKGLRRLEQYGRTK
jgi:hypothetical protein